MILYCRLHCPRGRCGWDEETSECHTPSAYVTYWTRGGAGVPGYVPVQGMGYAYSRLDDE